MLEKYRRHFLRTREAKLFLNQASRQLKTDLGRIFGPKTNIELVETDSGQFFLVNDRPVLVKSNERIFPTLVFNELHALKPKVVVDMGAIPHICNGANVMAPGIVRFIGKFEKDDFVFVVDEKHSKPIALGEAAYNVEDAEKATEGIVVKNVHFVGDKIWNHIKQLRSKT